jgi:uncharacterized protein (DUF1499 family)
MNAPERLLYHPDFTQQVVVSLPEGRASIPHTEYVRADLYTAVLARADRAEALLKEAVEALTAVQVAYDGQGVNRKEMDIVRATLAKIKEQGSFIKEAKANG